MNAVTSARLRRSARRARVGDQTFWTDPPPDPVDLFGHERPYYGPVAVPMPDGFYDLSGGGWDDSVGHLAGDARHDALDALLSGMSRSNRSITGQAQGAVQSHAHALRLARVGLTLSEPTPGPIGTNVNAEDNPPDPGLVNAVGEKILQGDVSGAISTWTQGIGRATTAAEDALLNDVGKKVAAGDLQGAVALWNGGMKNAASAAGSALAIGTGTILIGAAILGAILLVVRGGM